MTSKCSNIKCDYNNITFQCFNYLDLSIYNIINEKKITNLEECIKYYEREIISEFKCEKCGSTILMKNTIYKLPKILIINFNRVYDKYHLNYLVKYPEYFNTNKYFSEKPKFINNSLTSESNYYSLNGIIVHYGNSYSGHKTAFCKNFFNDKWYYFDDNYVENVNEFLEQKEAFILVYVSPQDFSSLDILTDTCDKNAKIFKAPIKYYSNRINKTEKSYY